MAFESLKLAFRYPLIKVGFVLLILALLLSLISMYSVSRHYSERGSLTVGNYTLGNDDFEEKYFVYNRTLVLSGYGEIKVNGFKYYVEERATITPSQRPQIEVLSGNFSYSYSVVATDYPLGYLSLLAFVFFLVGITLSLLGYMRMMGDLRGGGQ